MNIPGNTQYGIWLRAPSVSGGKDWVGFLTDRDVISQWGKTGQVNQSKTIGPVPSRTFLDQKIEEKKGKGYRLIGEWFPSSGWSHQRQPSPAPPPEPPRFRTTTTPPVSSTVMTEWLFDRNSDQWF